MTEFAIITLAVLLIFVLIVSQRAGQAYQKLAQAASDTAMDRVSMLAESLMKNNEVTLSALNEMANHLKERDAVVQQAIYQTSQAAPSLDDLDEAWLQKDESVIDVVDDDLLIPLNEG